MLLSRTCYKVDIEEQKRLRDVYFQSEPKQYKGREGETLLAKCWAMIELIDDNVGRLIKTLKETGLKFAG